MIDSKWVSVLNADSEAVIRFFKHALVCYVFLQKTILCFWTLFLFLALMLFKCVNAKHYAFVYRIFLLW